MEEEKKKSKVKIILRRIKKRVKLRTILLLMLTFAANSYAWFIYTTRVENQIEAHVRSWSVSFESASGGAEEFIKFSIDDMYPGMEEFKDSIKAVNNGENKAKLSYEIVSFKIMDTLYESGKNITSEELLNKIRTEYPFKIILAVTNEEMDGKGGESEFTFSVTWPYESGDDVLDTYWGNKAYEFHALHPDEKIIELEIKISAVQVN